MSNPRYNNQNSYEDELRSYLNGTYSNEEDYYDAEGDEDDFYNADGYEEAEGDEEDYYDADGDEEEYDEYDEEEMNEYNTSGGGVEGSDDIGASFDGYEDDYDTGDDIDSAVYEVDFSQFDGDDFVSALNGVNKRVSAKSGQVRRRRVPPRRRRVEQKRTLVRRTAPVRRQARPMERGMARPMQKPMAKRPMEKRPMAKPMAKRPTVKRPTAKPMTKKPMPQAGVKPKRVLKKTATQQFGYKKVPIRESATIHGKGRGGTTKRVIVPSSQKVIVEGVDRFILSKGSKGDNLKNVGYYKGKKLKELVLSIDNNSALDFNVELFNPSEPLDYLYSTSGNLNNKIQVSGGITSYSDVLFNILANPTHLVNAKFTFAGLNYVNQINQPLIFKNKSITGEQVVEPMQLALQVDNMQVIQEIVFFDIFNTLGRPFIPNGMDVIQYKVLAGNTVNFAFFYEQKDLRKFFFQEARDSKKLL